MALGPIDANFEGIELVSPSSTSIEVNKWNNVSIGNCKSLYEICICPSLKCTKEDLDKALNKALRCFITYSNSMILFDIDNVQKFQLAGNMPETF